MKSSNYLTIETLILNNRNTYIVFISEVFAPNLGFISAVSGLNCLDQNSYLILTGKKYAIQKGYTIATEVLADQRTSTFQLIPLSVSRSKNLDEPSNVTTLLPANSILSE